MKIKKYTNLLKKKHSEIRDEYKNKWKSVTLEQVESDLEHHKTTKKINTKAYDSYTKLVSAYKKYYKKESETMTIKP